MHKTLLLALAFPVLPRPRLLCRPFREHQRLRRRPRQPDDDLPPPARRRRPRRVPRDLDQPWCSASDAQAAGQACVSAFLASGGSLACAGNPSSCFEVLTENTPCAADGPIYPTAASCQSPVPRTCAFYSACLEAEDPCGASGYAIGYGEKYCSRYDVNNTFSPEGIVWRNTVLHCLQDALVPILSDKSMTCDAITNFAFDSHPGCYTANPSICFLPPSDALNVVSVIDGRISSASGPPSRSRASPAPASSSSPERSSICASKKRHGASSPSASVSGKT